jgi:hypothetical protein
LPLGTIPPGPERVANLRSSNRRATERDKCKEKPRCTGSSGRVAGVTTSLHQIKANRYQEHTPEGETGNSGHGAISHAQMTAETIVPPENPQVYRVFETQHRQTCYIRVIFRRSSAQDGDGIFEMSNENFDKTTQRSNHRHRKSKKPHTIYQFLAAEIRALHHDVRETYDAQFGA